MDHLVHLRLRVLQPKPGVDDEIRALPLFRIGRLPRQYRHELRLGHLPARQAASRRNPFQDPVREVRVKTDAGKGSAFTLHLPLAPEGARESGPAAAQGLRDPRVSTS